MLTPSSAANFQLPPLDAAQEAVRLKAEREHAIFRGAPGSGKTTTVLAVVADAYARGVSFVVLTPDRGRADRIVPYVRAIAPHATRPVKTSVGFAYSIIDSWRNFRADPLGGVELLTGAQEDAQVEEALIASGDPRLTSLMSDGHPSALMRMEMRNFISTADHFGLSRNDLYGIAENLNFPLWKGSADLRHTLSSEVSVEHRGALRLRHSTVERMAADLVGIWEDEAADKQVTAALPVPDVVVVDGLQDMTASTIYFLSKLAEMGARIVASSEPDASVATYRGAIPQADLLLARNLGVDIQEITTVYRGSADIRSAVRRITDAITVAGVSARRRSTVPLANGSAQVFSDAHEGARASSSRLAGSEVLAGGDALAGSGALAGAEETPSVHLTAAHTEAQMGAHIARILRENYLFHGYAWAEQAVIVRSRATASAMRRHLRRGSVPINTTTRAFEFMTESSTRLMVEMLAAEPGQDVEELMSELVTSPLVGVDSVDMYRFLRAFTAVLEEDEVGRTEALTLPELFDRLRLSIAERESGTTVNATMRSYIQHVPHIAAFQGVIEKLTRAAHIWQEAQSSKELRPRHALWNVWHACGVADQWQELAISNGRDSAWYDGQLDAVVGLFRVADVWEQRNPAGYASDFVSVIRNHDLPIDTLTKTAQRPESVSVMTPAEAAGGEWKVVIVAGAQHERWPNVVLRNQMLHSDTLADVMLRRATGAEEASWAEVTHVRQQRRRIKDDEYRLFAAAIGTAQEELHLVVVSNDSSAPSELVDRALGIRNNDRVSSVERCEDGTIRYRVKPAPSPLDVAGVIGDLRYWAAHPIHEETSEAQVARIRQAQVALAFLIIEGIRGAHPNEWETPGALSSHATILQGMKPRISPSAVERIETCPLMWFANKIGADSSRGYSAATLGTFIHALAEEYHYDKSQSVWSLFERYWPAYSANLDPLDEKRERLKIEQRIEGLECYFEHLPEWKEELTEVEVPVTQDMGHYIISGKIDRIEPVEGGGFAIVDFKTGKAKSEKDVLSDPQLQTYQVAMRAGNKPVKSARLQYLSVGEKTGRNPMTACEAGARSQAALSPEEYSDRLTKLEEDVALMNANRFEARMSNRCDYCSLKSMCPAQQFAERTRDA